jgi:hypothetical protein
MKQRGAGASRHARGRALQHSSRSSCHSHTAAAATAVVGRLVEWHPPPVGK